VNNAPVILLLYVNDLFLTSEKSLITQCKKELTSEFDMKYPGLMHYYLRLEVWQKHCEIFLGQGKYTVKVIQKFGMMDCKSMANPHIFLGQGKYVCDILSRFQMGDSRPMTTPMITNWKKLHASESQLVDSTLYRQLIGSLMYLVNTRLDICFAVNTLSQFMVEPRRVH
jgi:hypothetical protein